MMFENKTFPHDKHPGEWFHYPYRSSLAGGLLEAVLGSQTDLIRFADIDFQFMEQGAERGQPLPRAGRHPAADSICEYYLE